MQCQFLNYFRLKDTKAVMVYRVLATLLELGKGIRGASGVSLMDRSVGEKAKNPYATTVLNMNYSDSGLFGVYFAAQPQDAGHVSNIRFGRLEKKCCFGKNCDKLLQIQIAFFIK